MAKKGERDYPVEIHKTIDKIEMVYAEVQASRATQNPIVFVNKPPSDGTLKSYGNIIKSIAHEAFKQFGITDIAKVKPKHMEKILEQQFDKIDAGMRSAFTFGSLPHAIHSFVGASKATGVFNLECRIGNKEKILDKMHDNGIIRSSEDSKSLKANHADYKKVDAEMANSKSPNAQIARDMHAVQRHFGFRIHEVVKMKVEELTKMSNSIRTKVEGKGGLVGYQTTKEKAFIDMLDRYCSGKNPGADVFIVRAKDGNQKSYDEVEKFVSKEVRSAAKRAGVDRDGKKYTAQSGRKAYGQSNMDNYKTKTVNQLQKIKNERIKNAPNGAWIQKKYNSALESIRNKMGKDPIKRAAREMTHKELCTWLTSIDLRHGRLDVVRYYAGY